MRKKNIFLLAALSFIAPCKSANSAWLTESSPDITNTVRYRISVAANVSTSTVLIDLNDTANWPHKETGEIDISSWRIELDKASASTTSVRLGVVTMLNASTGSVTWFYAKEHGLNVSNTDLRDYVNWSPNFIRVRVTNSPSGDQNDGVTPYLISSEKTSGSTTYQSDVNLPAPTVAGNITPGVGDVILRCENGSAAVTVNLTMQYHTRRK